MMIFGPGQLQLNRYQKRTALQEITGSIFRASRLTNLPPAVLAYGLKTDGGTQLGRIEGIF
jgi:hypothetical protein